MCVLLVSRFGWIVWSDPLVGEESRKAPRSVPLVHLDDVCCCSLQIFKNYSMSAELFKKKMADAGLSEAFSNAFLAVYNDLVEGRTGMMPEETIDAVESLPKLAELPKAEEGDKTLLGETLVLKLNGGLGTGMGLEKAKSLLQVKGEDTFLDFIAKQVVSPFRVPAQVCPEAELPKPTCTRPLTGDAHAQGAQHPSEIHDDEQLLHFGRHQGFLGQVP